MGENIPLRLEPVEMRKDDQMETESFPEESGSSQPAPGLTKTPFYQGINALRYQRQALVTAIQRQSGRRLICYVAGQDAPVDRDDVVCFVDLLHHVDINSNLDLLLHTGGGDIDAAEKLI